LVEVKDTATQTHGSGEITPDQLRRPTLLLHGIGAGVAIFMSPMPTVTASPSRLTSFSEGQI